MPVGVPSVEIAYQDEVVEGEGVIEDRVDDQ